MVASICMFYRLQKYLERSTELEETNKNKNMISCHKLQTGNNNFKRALNSLRNIKSTQSKNSGCCMGGKVKSIQKSHLNLKYLAFYKISR